MSEEAQTVCVWESGGIYLADDYENLADDIARALGAPPSPFNTCIKVMDHEHADGGAWLTVQIFAPYISKDWAEGGAGDAEA